MPQSSASCAENGLPVSIISLARRRPDRARQELRAARARHDAERHLGQREARRGAA